MNIVSLQPMLGVTLIFTSLSLAIACLINIGLTEPGHTQIVPDGSLRNESSRLVQNRPTRIDIDGGARRGANLFHSFREFNVGQEGIVYFRNPAGVENIFSRVTGGNPSNILGGLGVRGNANLFLINPNGILLGEQAIVNISGSFVATTANSIQFGTESFSAISPDLPSAILTINPLSFLFNQSGVQSAAIEQRGQLTVGDNQSIVMLGGSLQINGGQLTALNGRIELGTVQSAGSVILRTQFNRLSLEFPATMQRGDVLINNSAGATVVGRGAGTIVIQADNLVMNDSRLLAGANQSSKLSEPVIGNIELEITGALALSNSSILSTVPLSTTANSGNILIVADSLLATQGTLLETTNLGFGQAGDIQIRANRAVIFDGAQTRVRTATNRGLVAEAGNIQINAQSLAVTGGARFISSTFGQGEAGDITIIAPRQVLLEGSGANRLGGGLYSTVERNAVGNGGDVNIQTGNLTILDGASITARSLGQGNGGNISIAAAEAARLSGTSGDTVPIPSGIFSTIQSSASGNGGTIRIYARSLRIENGAQVQSTLFGEGSSGDVLINVDGGVTLDGTSRNGTQSGIFTSVGSPDAVGVGGNIRIFADSLKLLNQSQLTSSTEGQGNAGTVKLRIDGDILLDQGSIFANVLSTAIGEGGNIDIHTNSLLAANGSQLATSTAGRGDAGNISIRANNAVTLRGTADRRFATTLRTGVERNAIGQGGNIQVAARQIEIENGAQLEASTSGRGDAGRIQLNAGESIALDGEASPVLATGVFGVTTSTAAGRGGTIDIQTDRLELSNRSRISTQSQGRGDAGEITMSIGDYLHATDSDIITSASRSSGGTITVNAQGGEIRLHGDSNIRTEVTGGEGGAGNIKLTADSIIAFDDSDILAFANRQGGQIDLDTPVFFGESYRPASTAINPNSLDNNNQVDVNASARVPGNITVPDTSTIQNSLADLSNSAIDTENLLANSCIARTKTGGVFLITGTGGLRPDRPGSLPLSPYPTDTVRSTPDAGWQPGDPIVEPQGVYRLPNGDLVLMHDCQQDVTRENPL